MTSVDVNGIELRHAFIAALHPTGFSDLRALRPPRENPVQLSVAAGDFAAIDKFASDYQHRNIYIGVATRARVNGRRLEDCLSLHAIFADIDFKDFSSEAAARERLRVFPLPPNIIILSGGGLQCYWL